jgi:succinate dehydrogenase/fumarate reductase flavoprotein subunit
VVWASQNIDPKEINPELTASEPYVMGSHAACSGAWELQHRVLASECVTQHTMYRTETRWPGYYYRADHPKLDATDWHCFTLSQYDRESGKWEMEKAPVYHIID